MYDVKQVDPAEWSSPPWDAAIVEKPGLGKVVVGRGAVNQKGPEAAFLAALHAYRGAGRKLPVNFVFVAEGEEEIGSPHFPQIVRKPEIQAALSKCLGVFMPSASQGLDGNVTITLGAKGVIELELTSSGEKWGRGPRLDIHSSNKARVDSPAWHLVQALHTLVYARRQHPGDRGIPGARPPDLRGREGDGRRGGAADGRGDPEEAARGPALDRRRHVHRVAGAARLAADGQHRGIWSAAIPDPAGRRSCRTRPSPSSTCASCPT